MAAGPEHDAHAQLRKVGHTVDAAAFPSIVRALSEGNLLDYDAEFEFGLRALAAGLAHVPADRIAEGSDSKS